MKKAKSRDLLIEAADHLLAEEGSYAISARRVAERAGLKPQLVHYYFATMDDLIIAVFRRANQQHFELYEQATRATQPLRALWQLSIDQIDTRRVVEFISIAHRRDALRAEIVSYGEYFRNLQIDFVSRVLKNSGKEKDTLPAASLVMLMAAASRTIVTEGTLGTSLGHAALHGLVKHFLDLIEPLARPTSPQSPVGE